MAFVHTVWTILVATNLAQWYMDWILGLHFVSNPFWIQPFDLTRAVTLVTITFIFGYIGGWVLGCILRFVRR